MDDVRVERVLRAVECLEPGTFAPYSMIGRLTGTSARYVGRVMALYGHEVPWWRVTNVKGELPAAIAPRALEHWDEEGLVSTGSRLAGHQLADETELASRVTAATADLDAS